MNNLPFALEGKQQEIAKQIFRKDERFSWQNEYRIALEPTEKDKTLIEIGSIEDIAMSGKIEDFIQK